jgi:serine/threonine protein kinase
MGVVWLARDESLQRQAALKFLPEIVRQDRAAVEDLRDETRRCLELTHPNIVRIYDFEEDDHAAGISMEFVDGGSLSGLRTEKPDRMFETDELLSWLRDLCAALHYAHTEGRVVHRDLKPAESPDQQPPPAQGHRLRHRPDNHRLRHAGNRTGCDQRHIAST